MNKIFKFFITSLMVAIIFASCSPDKYEMSDPDVKSEDLVEGIAFKIEYDKTNPNIVYLTNLMGSRYTPLWKHPQGRSQEQKVTLKMPFAGTYEVTFGVQTQGGLVYGETVTFEIEKFYPEFVNNELWTMISGGVGKSKTWYLDLDANEVSRHFAGPLYFFTGTYSWDNLHTPSGDNYLDADPWNWKDAITPLAGDDGNSLWYWLADYPGNKWMCAAADFGEMTFDLIGGANIHVDQQNYGLGSHNGTYMLDVDKHTISFSDANPLYVSERTDEISAATQFRILYLSEDFMQIMIVPSGTCLNYISKDYRDSWTPPVQTEDPVPPIDGTANDVLTTTKSKAWTLSEIAPYDWTDLNGKLINNFSTQSSYISTGWAAYKKDMIAATKFTFTASNEAGGKFIFSSYGNADVEGTYTLDSKNDIDFGQTLSAVISETNFGWISTAKLETTSENKLRLLKTKTDVFGTITDMWLAQRLTTKDQYMVYHFILSTDNQDANKPGTILSVDNSKIAFGNLEGNGNLRIELYNEYGNTKTDPPIDKSQFKFSDYMKVTFSIRGINLKAGAAGAYKAGISFADGDWSVQYWGGESGDTTITGDGTYTVSFTPSNLAEGLMVYAIDIKNLAADIVNMDDVFVTIDKIEIK